MTPIVLAAPDRADEPDLVAAAAVCGVSVVRRPFDAADLLAAAAADPRIAIVMTTGVPRLSADLVGRILADDRQLVGLVATDADAQMLHAWGVRSIVHVDRDPVLTMQAIVGVLRQTVASTPDVVAAQTAPPVVAGRCIAVWGPPGAPGRTTTAVGLAASLAARGSRVCLVDADTYAPDLVPALGILDEISGLVVACRQAENGLLTPRSLVTACRGVSDGLAVLGGIPTSERWADVREVALQQVWQVARATFDVTVIDVGACIEDEGALAHPGGSALLASRRNAAALTALAAADVIVSVARASTLGIARALSTHGRLLDVAAQRPVVQVVAAERSGQARAAERALRAAGVAGALVPLVREPRRLEHAMRGGAHAYDCATRRERQAIDRLGSAVLAACA